MEKNSSSLSELRAEVKLLLVLHDCGAWEVVGSYGFLNGARLECKVSKGNPGPCEVSSITMTAMLCEGTECYKRGSYCITHTVTHEASGVR